MYTVRSVIFNLDHEIDSLHFILNGKDPIPSEYKWVGFICRRIKGQDQLAYG